MEKSLFEQVGGTYTQVGDYLLPNLTLTEEAQKSIGIGGQQHARYLKQYHKVDYYNYLTSGKLNAYLADIDKQAEEMFSRLVKDMADKQGIAENLKATDQMAWVGKILVTVPSPNALCRTMEPSLTSGATNSSCLAAIFAAAEAAGLTPYCAVTEGFSTA